MLELFIKTLIIGLATGLVILFTSSCVILAQSIGAKVKWRKAQPLVAKVQSARTDEWYCAERYCLRGDAMYLYVRSDNGECSWWPVERFRNAFLIAMRADAEWAKAHMFILLAQPSASSAKAEEFTEGAK